ncbi:uncharacterized protein LOC141685796 [Apium graveolens]|uniref:uncharacterized protein LOC141685796 n=1 Tax=Apium graveolens TaxID=4045 RepID=UPI003D795022
MDFIAKFSSWSGLSPNIHKSNSFLYNCDYDFTVWFDSLMIPRGTLLVRFLGVPLITSQLCVNDCMPLITKITSRLYSWTTLLLSLDGRALLIKYVICAIESFWCNHFLLPGAIHATIQSLLTRFLWCGNINHKGGAKIAWQTVCLPREEGGLGLKNMLEWNKAQLTGHLLKVITNSSTLWASWLRPLDLQFVSFHIGNGESISLWFDPWWNNACLASTLTSAVISQCGMHHGDKLSAIIHNGSWCLPRANPRSHHLYPVLLHWLSTFDPPALATDSDLLLWDGRDAIKTKLGKFGTQSGTKVI